MKKALIIANILFASATVWGMVPNDENDKLSVRAGKSSTIKQSQNLPQLSSGRDIDAFLKKIIEGYDRFFNTVNEDGDTPMQVAKNRENKMIKLGEAFDAAQASLKDNKWLPKEIKLILSKLNFEDISEYVKQNFWPSSSKEANYEVEKSAKEKAKKFFDEVLGSTRLGRDLYKKAVETIDSAKCIWSSYPANSYNYKLLGIECYYRGKNDLIQSLVHETAHVLDDFYKLRKKYGKSEAVYILEHKDVFRRILEQGEIIPQEHIRSEYVSIFFEQLIEKSLFINGFNGYSSKYRIWDLFKLLLLQGLKHELMASYNENRKLYDAFLRGYKRDEVISKLKKNPKIGLYIDTDEEWEGILVSQSSFKDRQNVWTDLLQKLGDEKNDKYCVELKNWLCNLEIGECKLIGFREGGKVFTFKKNDKIMKRSFPKLIDDTIEGNWEKFCGYVKGKKDLSWKDSLKNSNHMVKNIVQQLHHIIDEHENNIVNYGFGSWNNGKVFLLKICKSLENVDEAQIIKYFLPQLNENDWDEIKKLADDRLDNIVMQRYFERALKKWNCDDLIQLFRDTAEGKNELIDYKSSEDIIISFVFKKDGKQTEVPLPPGLGFDWKEIYEWTQMRSCFHSITPSINSIVRLATGRSACFANEEHLLGTLNAFNIFKKYNVEQILNNGEPVITEELMDELTEREPLIWTEESIEEFYNYLKTNDRLSLEWIDSIKDLLLHARSYYLEGLTQEGIETLKELEQYKPLNITEESAEEFMKFLRR